MNEGQNSRLKLWGLAAVLAICVAYANSFTNPFEFDDFHTITDNPAVRSLTNVPRFFTDASTFSVLPANRTYRPIVSTSLAIDYALGQGYKPLWFHLDTFVWFLVLLYLLWLLYRSAMDATESSAANAWLALFAAAWFGLHPAMAETVNYMIQRGDLYCTLDCVAALVLYVRLPHLRKFGVYLLPLITALLSKPPAAVFPVLLLFYVFFFETEDLKTTARWAKAGTAAVPSIAATAALMLLQSAMTPKSFAPSILDATAYRLVQPLVCLRYFGEFFLPLHLNIDTDLNPMPEVTAAGVTGIVFVLLLAAAIWASSRHKRTYPIAYGLFWFVVTQLPTSLYPLSEVENDHRMFFSFVGLILAVVWAARLFYEWATDVAVRVRLRPVLATCAVLLLSGYAWGTHLRNAVWHSEESVWHDDVLKSPHNGRGLMIYGLSLMNRGDFPGALDYFTRALQYTPNYPTLEINLAIVNGVIGNLTVAEQHFKRAISLAPQDDTTHAYYGRWLNEQERTPEAIAELRQAIALNPQRPMQHDELLQALNRSGNMEALKQAATETRATIPDDALANAALTNHNALGPTKTSSAATWINTSLAQYQQGKFADSIVSARHALEADPTSAIARNNIGAAQAAMGQWDEAIASEQQALKLQPSLKIAQNNLAAYTKAKGAHASPPQNDAAYINQSLALIQAGKFEEGIAAAKQALKLNPNSAEAWNNIAAANEAMKRWDPAIDAAKQAIALKPDFQLAKNNLAWSLSQKSARK